MDTHELEQLASRLLAGELSTQEFAQRLAGPTIADLGEAQLDLDRSRRCGFPEVVFAEGKTVAAMEKIFAAMLEHGVDVLATRMSAHQAAELGSRFPNSHYNAVGRTFRVLRPAGKRAAATPRRRLPGRWSSSRPERATCPWRKRPGKRPSGPAPGALIQDVGVAGPHRLTANLAVLHSADAVVVVAGMEGALPSVVGGHVACPVIAVPTSVGYGASFGGLAALLGMLNSCAANVAVVNIDAGFKGGYLAGLIAHHAARDRAPAMSDIAPFLARPNGTRRATRGPSGPRFCWADRGA